MKHEHFWVLIRAWGPFTVRDSAICALCGAERP